MTFRAKFDQRVMRQVDGASVTGALVCFTVSSLSLLCQHSESRKGLVSSSCLHLTCYSCVLMYRTRFTSLRTMHIDDVPQDVLYNIFGKFVQKRDLLYSCSLVSKRWHDIAFPHIFSSLSLLIRVDEPPEVMSIPINRFMQDLLADPIFPSIQHTVRSLKLKWGRAAGGDIDYDFADYIPHFPALSHLTLQGMVSARLPATYSHARGTVAIDSLTILGTCKPSGPPSRHPHNIEALCDLLSMFRSVGTLVLEDLLHWDDQGRSIDWKSWDLPVPQSLVLDRAYFSTDVLSNIPILKHTRALDVVAIGSQHDTAPIIACCGRSCLEKLIMAIETRRREPPEHVWTPGTSRPRPRSPAGRAAHCHPMQRTTSASYASSPSKHSPRSSSASRCPGAPRCSGRTPTAPSPTWPRS